MLTPALREAGPCNPRRSRSPSRLRRRFLRADGPPTRAALRFSRWLPPPAPRPSASSCPCGRLWSSTGSCRYRRRTTSALDHRASAAERLSEGLLSAEPSGCSSSRNAGICFVPHPTAHVAIEGGTPCTNEATRSASQVGDRLARRSPVRANRRASSSLVS